MKTLISVFCFTLLTTISVKAQNDTILCDAKADTNYLKTLPWYGNNNYLESFLDSIGYPSPTSRIVGTDRVKYRIPIKFWVYRNNTGTSGPTLVQLQSYIDNLNRFYNVENNTQIGFYMRCNVSYINSPFSPVSVNMSFFDADLTAQSNKEKGCINIHIVDGLPGNTIGVQLRARFFGVDGIFLAQSTYTRFQLASTIAHEVGHYLQLEHTHENNDSWLLAREPISRTRTLGNSLLCEKTGDLLKDTPADHELNSNNSCTYDITGLTDLWGDSYANPPVGASSPDPTNILSYNGLRTCCDFFSRQQIAVMLYSIERGKSNSNKVGWKDLKGEYDSYEPDNDATTARPILLREVQERNFHQQYTDEDFQGAAIWSNCDVDWIRYTPTCSASFFVETSAMSNRAAANTRLTLFNATGVTQLAQNDNISSTNLFSRLSFNFVAGTTYLIRVDNMAPGANVYYKISIGEMPIAGADNFCTSSVYSIPNLPAGASVTWSASPLGRVSFSPSNASPTTITRISDGFVTITANIALSGCIVPIVSKQVYVGKPQVSGTYLSNGNQQPLKLWLGNATTDYNNVCNLQTTTTTMQISGATSGTWTRTAANPTNTSWSQSGNNLSFYLWSTGQTAVFRLQASNACGTTTSNYGFKAIACGGGGGGCSRYKVSPNPATGYASIVVINIPPPCDVKIISEKEQAELFIKTVRIYDNAGVVKKNLKFSASKKSRVLLSGLKSGIYFIEISDGVYTEKQQLVIVE